MKYNGKSDIFSTYDHWEGPAVSWRRVLMWQRKRFQKINIQNWKRKKLKVRYSRTICAGLTSEKKSESMMRLIQWMTLANWKALETVGKWRGGEEEREEETRGMGFVSLEQSGGLHWRSLVSMSSSSERKSTTRMTQATRMQLKPALSRHTCHRATRRPQQGFSQLDLHTGDAQNKSFLWRKRFILTEMISINGKNNNTEYISSHLMWNIPPGCDFVGIHGALSIGVTFLRNSQ